MSQVMKKEEEKTKLTQASATNYFEDYGNRASNRAIVGRLLKFSKGDWLAGEDAEEMERGYKLVAQMDTLSIGWIKWVDSKPEQQIMGLVVEGYQPPRRADLGDLDKGLWEVDVTSGQPRDPWQFSNYLICKEVGKKGDEENLYTMAASSRGGINAIGDLCKTYGKKMREMPDEYPVIALGVDSYEHSNKAFGRIKVPVLEVVAWEGKKVATEEPKRVSARKK